MNRKIKVALLQLDVVEDKQNNIENALLEIESAAKNGADIVVLPEMFCCQYSNKYFAEFAEEEGGYIWQAMQKAALENKVYLIAGSMPEKEDDRIYNTCFAFDRNGLQIGKHRKIHLFDINVSGGQSFCESATFSKGDSITIIETEFCKIGICICFDMRFPELSRIMALEGAQMIITPAAFNMTTGPAHWEILFRQRAVDNQLFTIGVSTARNEKSDYVSYGNSIAVSPWGDILYKAGDKKDTSIIKIDLNKVQQVRSELPLLFARRTDLYDIRRK